MSAAALRERVGTGWVERADGWWLGVAATGVRPAAKLMLEGGARFAALLALPVGDARGLRLCWHFDLKGTLLTIETFLGAEAAAPSIVELFPGADWAERETRDYYAVSFEGRASTPPLMLREGDEPGILLRGGTP